MQAVDRPDIDYPGIDGFLGTRAPLVLDLLVLSMIGVVVALAWSIYEVKYRRRYQLHKWVQIALGVVLLSAVTLFEIDIRLHGWEDRAAGQLDGYAADIVWTALYVHLVFAVSAVILWPFTIVQALRKFPPPAGPNIYSRRHVFWGWLAAVDMLLTAVTGWTFYYLAFVR